MRRLGFRLTARFVLFMLLAGFVQAQESGDYSSPDTYVPPVNSYPSPYTPAVSRYDVDRELDRIKEEAEQARRIQHSAMQAEAHTMLKMAAVFGGIAVIGCIVFGIVGYQIGERKGCPGLGVVVAIFLGPIGLLVLFLMPDTPKEFNDDEEEELLPMASPATAQTEEAWEILCRERKLALAKQAEHAKAEEAWEIERRERKLALAKQAEHAKQQRKLAWQRRRNAVFAAIRSVVRTVDSLLLKITGGGELTVASTPHPQHAPAVPAQAADDWYVEINGEKWGPGSSETLKRLALQGKVTPEMLVRNGLSGSWVPASQVRGLFPMAASPGTPTTVAPSPEPDSPPSVPTAKPHSVTPRQPENVPPLLSPWSPHLQGSQVKGHPINCPESAPAEEVQGNAYPAVIDAASGTGPSAPTQSHVPTQPSVISMGLGPFLICLAAGGIVLVAVTVGATLWATGFLCAHTCRRQSQTASSRARFSLPQEAAT